ncbi:hypothetical protein MPTK1_5g06270 [Marchantia polymorpha subsp. ruderalis]|uniref:Uncharacterized protein n=2 Tax=Marchantia polymorpha TaxID=3197 RepID=A0AAF6BFI6_MARPO|nr:hypothetical protein MARPO_0027s0001 [Marchantia polymorpha]BBN10770.1 hypothetical protein Mp_5g06270 [Marchantia polymorpha subsp. ruderalis]|eukprot:PTQ42864.1 hypothetical protein MARPO_0027s0001 [Marchantia polymorpha]
MLRAAAIACTHACWASYAGRFALDSRWTARRIKSSMFVASIEHAIVLQLCSKELLIHSIIDSITCLFQSHDRGPEAQCNKTSIIRFTDDVTESKTLNRPHSQSIICSSMYASSAESVNQTYATWLLEDRPCKW